MEQRVMNKNESPCVQSNRPALHRLHRLHRRHAGTTAACCAMAPRIAGTARGAMPETVVGLPQDVVKKAGMLELLAAELRIAELEKALDEAREAACVDSLTGALNRRGFDEAYRREISRACRNGAPLVLAMIDLDDFKRLNDTHGHQAGDKALSHLVKMLHESMRPTDVLARFGGEEFVLMLPDTALDDARAAISRFLGKFSAQAIPGTECSMTFSAGVVLHDYFESLEEVIQRADAAAYDAKRSGKNRVIAA